MPWPANGVQNSFSAGAAGAGATGGGNESAALERRFGGREPGAGVAERAARPCGWWCGCVGEAPANMVRDSRRAGSSAEEAAEEEAAAVATTAAAVVVVAVVGV